MKIALAIFQLEAMGGKERDCLAIAAHLIQRGHDVSLVTTRARDLAFPITVLPAKGMSNHGRARAFADAVIAWHKREAPHLLLSFERVPGADFYYAADDTVAARMAGAKRFLPRGRTYLQLERGVFDNPHARFFFLTDTQRARYAAHYDFDPARGIVLPVILHEERYIALRTAAERDATRREIGLPQDAVAALAVAVKPKQKGLDRSFAALAHFEHLHLVSVGSTEPWIMREATALKIENRVHVLPYGTNVMSLMRACDFLLHPARAEAAGQVIVESLLAGRPAIVSGLCGYAGAVASSGAGIVLREPFDPQELSTAIATMLAQRDTMTAAAATKAEHLHAERGRWLTVIADALERAGAAQRVPQALQP